MEKITFCIPSKNNLRYLKSSIESIKKNGSIQHDILVYLDMSQDGTEEWLIENNIKFIKNETENPMGIAYGYNRCIEEAITNVVCMFHADMYMGKGFDVNVLKHLTKGTVVSATRIEPPLHAARQEKLIINFGMYPEDFDKAGFDSKVEELQNTYKDVTTRGIFAPWIIYKNDVMSIGMHDEKFHSYQEDSDIFNRFILSGYTIVQSRDAFVYHLTCRGGQFQDGIEQITLDTKFHSMKDNAARNYLRKWGSWIQNDEYQYPIIPHKYNIAFVVENCDVNLLAFLEPWCDRIYLKQNAANVIDTYINSEQSNTSYDLCKRVLHFEQNDSMTENDIIITFDARLFTQNSYIIVQSLSELITECNETGHFVVDCFHINIKNLQTYEHNLIHL